MTTAGSLLRASSLAPPGSTAAACLRALGAGITPTVALGILRAAAPVAMMRRPVPVMAAAQAAPRLRAAPDATLRQVAARRRYWGVSPLAALDAVAVQALASELATDRFQLRDFDCAGGAFVWFAWPADFGAGAFWSAGLRVTAWEESRLTLPEDGQAMLLYRSAFMQHGLGLDVEVR